MTGGPTPDRLEVTLFPATNKIESGAHRCTLNANMPKRSYPFSESFSSQYKVHVGQRELTQNGVFGGKYRQEIYGKH